MAIVKKQIPTFVDEPLDIKGATLLSEEEVKSLLTEKERAYVYWWWLRTPGGYSSRHACYVSYGGSVNDYGVRVSDDDVGVRPALIINLESSDLEIGDIFKFGGKEFQILSPTIAWLFRDDIGRCAFRKDWKTANASNYETSDVKKIIDEWFAEANSNSNNE